ncbi:hypothetical protein PGTUg99_005209 [Puccinia graminis f. sp. tritici]|uniref:Uncharacterized protein n=1 Tax=Puccinia graminis f. sp. tritici TaxID=56615 RepID=A0A5B0M8K2_PUCGR|nr:hypothetical protein PGTUg99_005209 [Puccinia graminis f. sp. tritici]
MFVETRVPSCDSSLIKTQRGHQPSSSMLGKASVKQQGNISLSMALTELTQYS